MPNYSKGKKRCHIMMHPQVYDIVRKLGTFHNKTVSAMMEDIIKYFFESNKIDNAYFKIMTSPYCSKEESRKINESLKDINPNDIQIETEHLLCKINN